MAVTARAVNTPVRRRFPTPISVAWATSAWRTLSTSSATEPLPVPEPSLVPTTEAHFPEEAYRKLERFVSTESGIPDYRSPNGAYTKGHRPTMYGEFIKFAAVRQRYWARSMEGWHIFSSVRPNRTHHGLAQLERAGRLHHLITQNVDRLHHMAGSTSVTELHGTQYEVVCVSCRQVEDRHAYQGRLERANPHWTRHNKLINRLDPKNDAYMSRPDGDVELQQSDYSTFTVPHCQHCGGILKPGVVMFGENVPKPTVDAMMDMVQSADGVLAAGTSLMVFSAFRFIRRAADCHIPIAILNVGPTRADDLASVRVAAITGPVLERLQRDLVNT